MEEATNGFLPETSPNPGSKKRRASYEKSLSHDNVSVVFDDVSEDILMDFAWRPQDIVSEKEYLNSLTTPEGHKFSRSIKLYSQIREGVLRFGEDNYTSFRWNANYREALKEMMDEYSLFHLSPIHFHSDEDIRKALPKEGTSAGYTRIITGKSKKGDNLDNALANFLVAVDAAKSQGSFNMPILVAYRTQASGEYTDDGQRTYTCKSKTRAVSAVALPVIIAELMFSKPFQYAYSSKNVYCGGKNDLEINRIIQTGRSFYNWCISLDYSHYDQSISNWLIEDAFEIIRHAFSDMTPEDEELWNVVKHDFIHKKFILSGEEVTSHKGVPSGSMFTQIIDSLVNELMIRTAMKALGMKEDHYQMQIMGDDNLIMYLFDRDIADDLCSYIQKNFGIIVNLDKTSHHLTKKNPEFLSRLWTPQGVWRHPFTLLSRILFPEKFRPYATGEANPWDVIYSYCIAYPLGMAQLIDVYRFKAEAIKRRGSKLVTSMEYQTGFIRYREQYGTIKFPGNERLRRVQ